MTCPCCRGTGWALVWYGEDSIAIRCLDCEGVGTVEQTEEAA